MTSGAGSRFRGEPASRGRGFRPAEPGGLRALGGDEGHHVRPSPGRRGGAAVAIVAACWLLVGCGGVGDVVRVGPISQSVAETNARMSSGVSFAAVTVVSSRLSTYGQERPGRSLLAPDAQVWVVILSGSFPYGSCRIQLPGLGSAPPASPCPTPTSRERVLLDARSGKVIEVVPGG